MAVSQRCAAVFLLLAGISAHAQARFDLPGPRIDIRVTRAGVELPIAAVPNLQPFDQVWLHPAFPADQSAHYLLIAAFLRGTTNPPPDNWFIRIETWDKKVREEGVTVTVPDGAQQAILFLAPETGGDFSTLRSAVKGRPGVFVRASQDLNEAGFEQGRIQKYLEAMKQVPPGDPKAVQDHSDLLARTLALRPNPDCIKRDPAQQYSCLTQTGGQTLLDDGHGQTLAAVLSNGPNSDFINTASQTQLAGGGNYSAYVGALVDLVRITAGLHTAKYQYIPAIAFPAADSSPQSLDLRLNTAPSFNDPKSVIVIGLPAVQKSVSPPLRPVDPSHISCLLDPHVALPIDGAPLVFTTAFAHNLVLHLNVPKSSPQDIPLIPDAYQGGLVPEPNAPDRRELPNPDATRAVPVLNLATGKPSPPKPDPKPAAPLVPGEPITGTIEGLWGFDRFTGPTLPLQEVPGTGWRIVSSNQNPGIIVGQPNRLQIVSSGTACVKSVSLEAANSPTSARVDWKLIQPAPETASVGAKDPPKSGKPPVPEPIDITLNLQHDAAPGSIHLVVEQFGERHPDLIDATTFVEPPRIETLQLHAGDSSVLLTGSGLDQVKSLTVKDLTFLPVPPSQTVPSSEAGSKTEDKSLALALAPDAKAPSLKPSEKLAAEVHLRDGRSVPVSTLVLAPRPAVSILSRRVSKAAASAIDLAAGDDLALGSQLIFFLKSKAPFLRTNQIEIASQTQPDEPAELLHTTLSIANGSLILEDAHTILATFDPLKIFGPSTFGAFHLRPIAADGTAGEWIPLATIVRLPTLTSIVCPADPAADCSLTGSGLYLIDSISLAADFSAPTKVPEGFVDTTISLPHLTAPASAQPATFYVRLRDDPATAQPVTLAVQSDAPPPPPTQPHTRNSKPTVAPGSHPAPPPPTPAPAVPSPPATPVTATPVTTPPG